MKKRDKTLLLALVFALLCAQTAFAIIDDNETSTTTSIDNATSTTTTINDTTTSIYTTTTSIATTTVPPYAGNCRDWEGTWDFTYDGKGLDGDYEVQICDIQENVVFSESPDVRFPCVAQGVRTYDGQNIYIIASHTGDNAYYYYEVDSAEYEMDPDECHKKDNARIPYEDFTGSAFEAEPNKYCLVEGVKIDSNSCDNETDNETCGDNDTDDDYGLNCPDGECTDLCEDCIAAVSIFPSTINRNLSFFMPVKPFLIISRSSVDFQAPCVIDWGTQGIVEIADINLGKKILFGLIYVRPMQLADGSHEVSITIGDGRHIGRGFIQVVK